MNEYFFIDFPTALITSIFIILNLVVFFPGKIGIHFPVLEIQVNVIETLLRTLSIFVGIIFSFIVLSFNIFYRYFGRFAFLNFFKNRLIKILFTLFIVSIAFMIYSLGYMKEIRAINQYSNSIFILSIIFSVITVFSIFPTVKLLLNESQNRENIHKLIKQLNSDWIYSYHENVLWDNKSSYKHYQKDPITLLTEIGTVAIKEFDQTTLNTMIQGCKDFFQDSINNKKKEDYIGPKQLYEEFGKLIKNLFQVAAKERNKNALFLFVRSRFDFEISVIKNIEKVGLTDYNNKYQGWSYNFDIRDFFNRAIQFNEDEVCRRIIDSQRDFITELIKAILPTRKFDYDFEDRMKYMDETSMISNALREADIFLSSIINTKKFHLFQNISNFYSTLDLVSIGSDNTRNSKIYLLHVFNHSKLDNFEKFIRHSDIKMLPMLYYPFQMGTTQALTEIQSRIPFITSIKAIDILFSFERLNTMAINSLKADIMFLIKNIDKNKINKELIKLSVDKFDYIRSLIKKKDNDYRKDIYLKLERHLVYIQNVAVEVIPSETEILDLIQKIILNFTLKDKFTKKLESKGYFSNDNIV